MAEAVPHLPVPARNADALAVWLNWHGVIVLAALGAAAATGEASWLTLAAAVSFAGLWFKRGTSGVHARGIGVANGLTATRLVALVAVAAAMPRVAPEWVAAAFALNVALDAVDGRVARRLAEASPFGAVFDREVDALFVAIAYLYFYLCAGWGGWVLLAGALPYVYRLVAARVAVAADHKERGAAALAAVNFLLLVGAVALPAYAPPIVGVSIAVVTFSFGRSFWNLIRHGHSLPQ